MQKGFTLIELLITMAIIAVLSAIAIPMMQEALLKTHISAAATDAHAIYTAFKRFNIDRNGYPFQVNDPSFELDTFEPLVSLGYYDGRLTSRLLNKEADGYDSPDDGGSNQEFWLEFTLAADPSVRFLVADSDDAPLAGGAYMDGVFVFRNGALIAL